MELAGNWVDETVVLKRTGERAVLTLMTEDTLAETLALRERIREDMEHKEWFAVSGEQDFRNALYNGFAINCTVDGKVIASVQCILEHTEYAEILFDEPDSQALCADYSDTFVDPAYRGNGLQAILEDHMETLCRANGKMILIGTVDPENKYSYGNFLKNGYEEADRRKLYGGLDRFVMKKNLERCDWGFQSELDRAYHDHRWCKPIHEDRELFAMLCLEGMQAGLSWAIILKREQEIREAFDQFDPAVVSRYDETKIADLKENPKIIRNRLKIQAAVKNAKAFLQVQQEFGSFDAYIWSFTNGQVIMNHPKRMEDVPAESELSRTVSRNLKKRGFSFVGPVIIYSYLQAIGVINDHLDGCPRKYQ